MSIKLDFQNSRRYGDIATIVSLTGASRSYVEKVLSGKRPSTTALAESICAAFKTLEESRRAIRSANIPIQTTNLDLDGLN